LANCPCNLSIEELLELELELDLELELELLELELELELVRGRLAFEVTAAVRTAVFTAVTFFNTPIGIKTPSPSSFTKFDSVHKGAINIAPLHT